jgi:hypothetical protein
MIMRWVWRALAVFLGRKAWEASQRRRVPSAGDTARGRAGRG